MTGPAVQLHDVTIAYDGHPAVHHVSGTFLAGAQTAILGPNGAGKSTLLQAIAGLRPPDEGRIDLGVERRRVAYLPQNATIDRTFPITVLDVVLMGHWARRGGFLGLGRAERAQAEAALAAVSLEGFAGRQIGTLSVGQFQRMLFARLLVQNCPLILLDEPFNGVDDATIGDLLRLIAGWRTEGRTVIAVLHDLAQVRAGFDQMLLLARRCVAWGPTVATLAENGVATGHLAEAWRDDASWCAA